MPAPMIWAIAAAAGVFVIAMIVLAAPARVAILVDTTASTARADVWPLWGLLPRWATRALPKGRAGEALAVFNDAARAAHALMTPGIADAVYEAVQRMFALKPRTARLALAINLGDPAQNRVVQTAAEAALAVAPLLVRDSVFISKRDAAGAELTARFEVTASPLALWAIWRRLKHSGAAKEFRRRLKRRPKPPKRPVREVRTT